MKIYQSKVSPGVPSALGVANRDGEARDTNGMPPCGSHRGLNSDRSDLSIRLHQCQACPRARDNDDGYAIRGCGAGRNYDPGAHDILD